MARRYGLRDDQWTKIEHLLPAHEDTVGATRYDKRAATFLGAIYLIASITWLN